MLKLLAPVPAENPTTPVPLQSELYSRLQNAVAQLKEESEKVHANMERALFRIMTQKEGVNLDGLSTGRWETLAQEVSAIQEALQAIEDVG